MHSYRTTMVRALLVLLALFASAVPADAQIRCTEGKPCGNTCIAQNKTCRIGTGSATRMTPTPSAVSVPEGAQFVASTRGRVYYWTGCAAWKSLAPGNLRFFTTREDAERAGYTPSRSRGCAGPATLGRAPPETTEAESAAGPLAGTCTVRRVVDGDTVECREGERVRLLLIDAPEIDRGDYGLRSKVLLETLLPAGTAAAVELDVQERDRYGRVLAYLYAPDGTMVNEELVRAGYAVVSVYPPNVRYVERLRAAQAQARENGVGLWSGPAFECLPTDHRRGQCE